MIPPSNPLGVLTLTTPKGHFYLEAGTWLSFGLEDGMNPEQMFAIAACASGTFNGRPVVCRGILPGVDLCITIADMQGDATLDILWPLAAFFMERWVDTCEGQTQTLESYVGRAWITLSRHGAESYEDAAMTLEQLWSPGSAGTGGWRIQGNSDGAAGV